MKYHIKTTLEILDKKRINDYQYRLELFKYKIRKLSIEFSKKLAKNAKKETQKIN